MRSVATPAAISLVAGFAIAKLAEPAGWSSGTVYAAATAALALIVAVALLSSPELREKGSDNQATGR
jgi:hypothetical protein